MNIMKKYRERIPGASTELNFGTFHTQCLCGTGLKSSSSRKIARPNDFLFEQEGQKTAWRRHCGSREIPETASLAGEGSQILSTAFSTPDPREVEMRIPELFVMRIKQNNLACCQHGNVHIPSAY